MNMEHYLEQLNLTEMMAELDGYFTGFSWNMQEIFGQILKGNFRETLEMAGDGIRQGIWAELGGFRGLLASLLVIGLLSVLVSVFMTSFENHQTAQIAHYIFYLLLMTVLLKIFSAGYELAEQSLTAMTGVSRLTLPALCLSLGPAAGSITAAGYYELALVLIFLVETFLLNICLPLMPVFMLLLLMNGVWEEGRLSSLASLLEKGVIFASKCCIGAVTGLGVLQSMVAPALDSLKRTTAQKAVSAIPALGDLAEGTTQILIGSAVLVKNSVGLFTVVLLTALLAVPFFKIFAYGALLKTAGALIGIVADKRLVGCIERTADAVFLMLRLAVSGAACFLILTAVVICLVRGGG